MLKSDVDAFLTEWTVGDIKVFESWNYFSKDYVVIDRRSEDLFVCSPEYSTSDMGAFNRDEMARLVSVGIFIHLPDERFDQDFRAKRSAGCCCGASRTSNPDCHAFHCPKWRKS